MDREKQLQEGPGEEEKDEAMRRGDYGVSVQQDVDKASFRDSADFMTIDQREAMRELDDNQLVGPPPPLPPPVNGSASTSASALGDVPMADVPVSAGGTLPAANRKRGRPPRAQGKIGRSPPLKKQVAVDEEEDVCFICFDGGSLVLCDRRGCPKAYHPTCIKRDEAFFQSKAKWNCGWHLCNSCQKASYYMCYTCPYSLCKGCTKDADYVCVRDNKGFCGTCMKTILLIENVKVDNAEPVQVDFDDKTSWEYLFKVYWVCLKDKESLTINELTNAKNPWKGGELPKPRNSWKRNGFAARKEILTGEYANANNEPVSCLDNCNKNGEGTPSKRRKGSDQTDQLEKNSPVMEKSTVEKAISLPEAATWATKALLEFVAHMKDGDASMLSQSDVQALLLEYIKRNNLRDPCQKAEVVCDARLTKLFRKPRVGHLEMLKLLEYHFLTKEKSPSNSTDRSTVADASSRQLEGASCSNSQLATVNDRQHKTNKKMNGKGSQINPNTDEYAAIDVHNINLLYLKFNLMEKLLDDLENFHKKVVGSFVRIKIAVGDGKQDVYRLVQVVGTCTADEPYKFGSRTVNVNLEILNLDRKEVISIDRISDQDISEDECRRLRETIKCGLIKPLKMGEIREKAMVLQHVKVNDCLEAEILRLNNLRDRASEKGHRKELRECIQKLELLKSPKERERRLLEIPIVHMDPRMAPSLASVRAEDRNDNKHGAHLRLNNSGASRKGIELNSSPGEGDVSDIGHRALKTLAAASEQVEMNARVDPAGTPHIQGQGKDSGTETVNFETEKLWHYQDPSGKIQGPFSMLQLRKWSEIKIFPDDFRVWRVNEKQQDSILLTDALVGKFSKEPPQPREPPQEATVASKDGDKKPEHGHGPSPGVTCEDNKRADQDQKPLQNDVQTHGNSNHEIAKSNGLDTQSISWIKAADSAVTNDAQVQADLPESSKSSSVQPQICASLPAPSSSEKSNEALLLNERQGSSNPSSADMDSLRTAGQNNAKDNVEKRAESEGHSSITSGENLRPQSMNSSTNGWDSNSSFLSMVRPIEKPEQNLKFDFSNMPSTAPMQAKEDLRNQMAGNKPPAPINVPLQDSGPPSWSTGSSLVIGGRQVPEVAVDWLSFSSAPAKPWDINLASPSSLKPTQGTVGQPMITTSGLDQLTLSSSSQPTIDAPNWHSMIPEPTEFCSLVDESVSDLLAEVEAMESLNGLPSPTSKLRYDLELTPGSDDDCFSPVERFRPPDQGKSDALSSTSDIQIPPELSAVEESLRLSLMPSQPTTTNTQLASSQVQQGIIQNDFLRASQFSIDPQRNFSGHSSGVQVDGDVKHSEVSVNQGNVNIVWGPGHGLIQQQQQSNTNSGVSPGNQGNWGSQPRHENESRHSGQRDHQNNSNSRDSGLNRDRSFWNRQPAYGSSGNGGGSKGQRVCKFYESGYCKKGASCSYWHP